MNLNFPGTCLEVDVCKVSHGVDRTFLGPVKGLGKFSGISHSYRFCLYEGNMKDEVKVSKLMWWSGNIFRAINGMNSI
jgi:hypothetical protein